MQRFFMYGRWMTADELREKRAKEKVEKEALESIQDVSEDVKENNEVVIEQIAELVGETNPGPTEVKRGRKPKAK